MILDTRAYLTDPANRTALPPPRSGWNLHASAEFRTALPPSERAALYRFLATFKANPLHALPIVVPDESTITKAALSPGTRQRLDQLAYVRGEQLCLTDVDLLFSAAANDAERQRLRRLLISVSALLVELKPDRLQPAAEMAAYWRVPGETRAPRWIVALEQTSDLESLDLANLLPSLPRRLLNTFPQAEECPISANCFWTSLNFWRDDPDDGFLPNETSPKSGTNAALAELKQRYVPVDPPYRFGDVLCLLGETPSGFELLHMVVHLADNIVFTKNGVGNKTPFIFADLTTVTANYAWAFQTEIRGFRLRSGVASVR